MHKESKKKNNMRENMIKDKAKIVFTFIALSPFIVPSGLQYFYATQIVYSFKYISFLYAIYLFYAEKYYKKNNFLFITFGFFFLTLIISSILNRIGFLDAVKNMLNILIPILFFDCLISKYEKKVLEVFIAYYGILALFNFITIILYPDGIVASVTSNKNYLISVDNKMVYTLLPSCGITLFYIERFSKSHCQILKIIITIMFFSLSLLVVWTATGVMAFFLMIFLLILNQTKLKQFLTLRNGLIFVGVVCYLCVFSKIFSKGVFGAFITDFLHKDISFSGRTILWAQALSRIKKSPLIGYGVNSPIERSFYFMEQGEKILGFSAHNGYLRILLEGGIFALVAYIIVYIALYKKSRKMWNIDNGIRILAYCVYGILLTFIFEAEFFSTPFLFLLTLFYHTCAKTLETKFPKSKLVLEKVL